VDIPVYTFQPQTCGYQREHIPHGRCAVSSLIIPFPTNTGDRSHIHGTLESPSKHGFMNHAGGSLGLGGGFSGAPLGCGGRPNRQPSGASATLSQGLSALVCFLH
jgi:hypothetical protein